MAARLNPKHDARTREKIRTSQLINRLSSFVNGEVELSPAQVTAALGLLKKTLPDLQATQVTGEIKQTYAVGDTPQMSKDEWAKQFGPSLH